MQLIFAINFFSLADSGRKQDLNSEDDLGGNQDFFDPANFDGMLIVCLYVCVHIRILVRTTPIYTYVRSLCLLYKVYHR